LSLPLSAVVVLALYVAGITAFVIGLLWLRTSEKVGFDAGGALDGVLSQLPVTLTAAALILLATGFELGAGLVLARAARRQPFDSVAEAMLATLSDIAGPAWDEAVSGAWTRALNAVAGTMIAGATDARAAAE